MASTPAEKGRGQPPLSLPRYRPWFYDLVRIASATFLLPFRLSASGLENVPAQGGVFPVRRAVQDMEAYEAALRMLRDGDMLLVFPEGTRNREGKARPQLGA